VANTIAKAVHYHQQQKKFHRGKVLPTTSSTTNRGKANILEKEESQITDSKQKRYRI